MLEPSFKKILKNFPKLKFKKSKFQGRGGSKRAKRKGVGGKEFLPAHSPEVPPGAFPPKLQRRWAFPNARGFSSPAEAGCAAGERLPFAPPLPAFGGLPCAGTYSLQCNIFHIGIYHCGIYTARESTSTPMEKAIYTQAHKHLIQQLKKARLQKGLDQNAVAKLLGTTQSYVSKIESGQRRIDVIQLREFAKIYGKKLSYFIA